MRNCKTCHGEGWIQEINCAENDKCEAERYDGKHKLDCPCCDGTGEIEEVNE